MDGLITVVSAHNSAARRHVRIIKPFELCLSSHCSTSVFAALHAQGLCKTSEENYCRCLGWTPHIKVDVGANGDVSDGMHVAVRKDDAPVQASKPARWLVVNQPRL